MVARLRPLKNRLIYAHYPTEVGIICGGVIESWLSEIGEKELARAIKESAQQRDPEMGVNRFCKL
jgi:hypothetical protein